MMKSDHMPPEYNRAWNEALDMVLIYVGAFEKSLTNGRGLLSDGKDSPLGLMLRDKAEAARSIHEGINQFRREP